jgi:hypothetical protein
MFEVDVLNCSATNRRLRLSRRAKLGVAHGQQKQNRHQPKLMTILFPEILGVISMSATGARRRRS